ncbi:alpha/beta hydrolase [Povalibacter sp.]|uniref:alpha/beta hydrolase n=1 Tax=Povalibacter sp. TaxID=1962978 RepID=UPI002F3E98B3
MSDESRPLVVFSHGLDGEPWGTKIVALAKVAKTHGLPVESVDYRGMEAPVRVEKLLSVAKELAQPLILVGSSLGGHVAASVSQLVPTRGMFLMAPAFFMPGFEQYTPVPAACAIDIVHGWNDDVVPAQNSIRFAQQYRATLHLIDSDHRLTANLDEVCSLFDLFLRRLGCV